ncbi:MAG: chromate transporter [Bryobacteraceae bacterium]
MAEPRLRALSWLYLRIANLTLGGGGPTMAALERELVERRAWLTHEQYGLAFGLARITPGTNMLAFCAGTGFMLRRWWGALLAVLTASVPSAALAVWLAASYAAHDQLIWVRKLMAAVSAAVIGMIASSVYGLVQPQFRPGRRVRTLIVTAAGFALAQGLGWSPIPVIALGAAAGWFWKEAEPQ